MATLTEIVQFNVNDVSTKIHQLKTSILKLEKDTKPCYRHPDGRVMLPKDYLWKTHGPEGWKYCWGKDGLAFDRTLSCIDPKKPEWAQFVLLKSEASLWLTARRILKVFNGERPTKAALRKAIREKKFGQHSPRHDQNMLVFKAFGIIGSLASTTEVDAWIAGKKATA